MGGFRKIRANGWQFKPLTVAVECGDDDRSFRDQRVCGHVRLADGGAFVVEAEHGNAGAQHVPGIGIAGKFFS